MKELPALVGLVLGSFYNQNPRISPLNFTTQRDLLIFSERNLANQVVEAFIVYVISFMDN